MKIFYYTFGCKVNQYETENVRELFEMKGHETVSNSKEADVCVINSCTVTAQADSKCFQMLRRLRKQLPEGIIVLAGCLPQTLDPDTDDLALCDIIVGTNEKRIIPELVERFIVEGERIVRIKEHSRGEAFEVMTNYGDKRKTRAYIKIQDGCDCYCTYCIIPYARGHIRSKPLDELLKEAESLISAGHKELILTGINLCFYGKDLPDRPTLTDAVEKLCSLSGDFRVRLGSIEPEMLPENDIIILSKLDKLCPHFHLSLQSGCSDTLKRMNRRYSSEEFADLCNSLRTHFPDCAITTDIMVGFPGETEAEFENSLEFVRKISFAEAHVFPYSRRPGTKADTMEGQVDQHTKHQRAKRMTEVCHETRKAYLKSCIGKEYNVLFERETEPNFNIGHAPNYITVKVPRADASHSLRRELKKVLIVSSDDEFCYGRFI